MHAYFVQSNIQVAPYMVQYQSALTCAQRDPSLVRDHEFLQFNWSILIVQPHGSSTTLWCIGNVSEKRRQLFHDLGLLDLEPYRDLIVHALRNETRYICAQ
jgi:hypothetical protein